MTRGYLVRYRTDLDGAIHKIEISVEGHSDMRMVNYPDVGAPIYGWLLAAIALAIAGALGYRLRSRSRLMGRLIFVGGQEAGTNNIDAGAAGLISLDSEIQLAVHRQFRRDGIQHDSFTIVGK